MVLLRGLKLALEVSRQMFKFTQDLYLRPRILVCAGDVNLKTNPYLGFNRIESVKFSNQAVWAPPEGLILKSGFEAQTTTS